MKYFVHKNGICESTKVGFSTRIWAFAHVLPHAEIGSECNICDGVFIENDVKIGNRVTIKCGVQVWDGVTLEDDVFVGPNVTFTNDPFPRSRQIPISFHRTIIRKGASLGANSTILPVIEIGENAMVGAGSVVTMSVPPFSVVMGNPARIVSYVGADKEPQSEISQADSGIVAPQVTTSRVRGVSLHSMPEVFDLRGNLTAGEFNRNVPFSPLRYFLVYDIPSTKVRGQHAHRNCAQFLICVRGHCSVVVDDGFVRQEYLMNKPTLGLFIPPLIWSIQYKCSQDAVFMVFASHYYDPDDYIRDYNEFRCLRLQPPTADPK